MISMNRGSRLIVWNVSIFTRIQKPWSCLGQYAKVTFFVFLHIDLWSNSLLHCTVAYIRPTNWVICATLPKVMQLFQIINHKGCIVCMYVCTKHLSHIHLNIWKDDRRSVLSVNTFQVQTRNKKSFVSSIFLFPPKPRNLSHSFFLAGLMNMVDMADMVDLMDLVDMVDTKSNDLFQKRSLFCIQ